jgi:tetratricopeptide (TPR) repeat protein
MEGADKNDPESRLALLLFRHALFWDQRDLARAARIAPSQLSVYEQGNRATPREILEKAAVAVGFPVFLLDPLLWALRSFLAVMRGRSRSARVFANGLFAELLALVRIATDAVLAPLDRPAKEETAAAELWRHLESVSASERRLLVEELEEFWSSELALVVAGKSLQRAPNHPKEALELADLALLIVERIPENLSLQSHTWAVVTNARRVCNDLPKAEKAIARARSLSAKVTPGDSGLVNRAWLPWIEAALRRDQRRFTEALNRIDEALTLDSGELRGEILLTKAHIHETLGDPEASTVALLDAASLIDPAREPRDAWVVRINLSVDLCLLGNFEEAESRLPEVQALAERLGEELDLTRVDWLTAKIAAGLGRIQEAREAFEKVQGVFVRRELTFDYALVSLELSVLLLEQGRTAEVKTLAEEMLEIFRTQQVEREALAALRLFCDAARREAATVELARRMVTFLHRAQHDPELSFGEDGKETGAR